MPNDVERLLRDLEEAKRLRPDGGRARRALARLRRVRFDDAATLARFHEAALFLRAYPHTLAVREAAERALASVPKRVARLARQGADLSTLDSPELSGIAGTSVTTDYSYDVVRFLAERFPRAVAIDWDEHEETDRLRALWPRFLPLLEEEALEDANVPYVEWLRAGQPRRGRDLPWLLDRIAGVPAPEEEKAERFDALGLRIRWDLSRFDATRTGQRWGGGATFTHDTPLLSRRDVSLEREVSGPPMPLSRLSPGRAAAAVAMTRTATALRYREYYGFTYADAGNVARARAGRGLEILFFGLPPDRRLPLRAGFAAFLVKNRVPIGYVEALAFFERVEIGFNVYYTFREGESAWIFGRVAKLLFQVLGARSLSIDPYQVGHENEEAIGSGAFWFYRKLGFRPTDSNVLRLVEREEARMARRPAHRTSPAALRKLATSNLIYGSGAWDRFHVRNIGLAVNRRMARFYGGDTRRARRGAAQRVARIVGVRPDDWTEEEQKAFENLSLVLDLIPDLP
ncbi:MAG TPA: hypothetical protein VIY96_04845, partial [Thermoanaerobaculia bacterium]